MSLFVNGGGKDNVYKFAPNLASQMETASDFGSGRKDQLGRRYGYSSGIHRFIKCLNINNLLLGGKKVERAILIVTYGAAEY